MPDSSSIIAGRWLPLAMSVLLAMLTFRSLLLENVSGELGLPPQRAANLAYRSLWRGDTDGAIRRFQSVAADDPAFPYRWSDLGSALADAGRNAEAQAAFEHALELTPASPQIALRAANFYFRTGQTPRALQLCRAVLRRLPLYQDMVFSLFYRFGGSSARVLEQGIGSDAELANNYFRFVHARDPRNESIWLSLDANSLANSTSARVRVQWLLRQSRQREAALVWKKYLALHKDDWLRKNFVDNAGFEVAPVPGEGYDWVVEASPVTRITRVGDVHSEGSHSLRIDFDGSQNVDFRNVSQSLWLEPGQYRLRASVRTEALTTDEGIRLQVSGPGNSSAVTESVTGTSDWHRVSASFTVVAAGPGQILLIRRPSTRFENRPRGSVWLDDIEISPVR